MYVSFGWAGVSKVSRRLFIGLLLVIWLPAGCTSPELIKATSAESTGSEISDAIAGTAEIAGIGGSAGPTGFAGKENRGGDPVMASRVENGAEENVVGMLPGKFSGEGEDDFLSVRIFAEIEADGRQYQTTVIFRNQTKRSLNILYDCGLPLSIDFFEPKTGVCPAVESMLLKGSRKETLAVTLPAVFFHTEKRTITVRYREDNRMHELFIEMQPDGQKM